MRRFFSLTLILLLATLGFAQKPKKDQPSGKDISVTPKKLRLEVKPTKKSYKVNEPIKFKVRVNKDAYLYVFNVGKEKVNQVYPQKGKKRLKAGKWVEIPKEMEFTAPKAGKEKFIFLASTKPMRDLLIIQSGKKELVGEEAKRFSKDLSVYKSKKKEVAYVEKEILIKPSRSQVSVITSSSSIIRIYPTKQFYRVGEKITLIIKARRSGTVTLSYTNLNWEKDEEGNPVWKPLGEVRVKKGRTSKFQMAASAPGGVHVIKAVFSSQASKDLVPVSGTKAKAYVTIEIVEKE